MTETTDLQRLIVSLEANIKKYEKELARANGVAADVTRRVERNFDRMNAGISAGFAKIAAVATGAFGVAALIAFSKKAIEAADAINDAAARAGVSTDSFQELAYAFKLAGVDAEGVEKALLQFTKRLGGAEGEVDEVAKALGRLGISVAQLKGQKPDQSFKLVADRIAAIKDPAMQAKIAFDLFGREGQKLLPTLRGGSAELARLAAEARKMGLVLSAETLKKAGDAADEFDRIGLALRAAGINISVGLLPALTQLREVMTDSGFQSGVRALAEGFGAFVKWMVENREVIGATVAALAAFKVAALAARGLGPTLSLGAGAVAGAVAFTEALKGMRSEVEKITRDLDRLAESDKRVRKTIEQAAQVGAEDTLLQQGRLLLQNETHRQALLKERARLLGEIEAKEKAANTAAVPRIEVNQGQKDPEVAKALEDTAFKARLARGEFDLLAEGFPEMVRGFELSRAAIINFNGSVSTLSPELLVLNQRMRELGQAKDLQKAADDFGKAFGRAFEDAVLKAKDFRDVLKSLTEELARVMLRLLITNQLERGLKSAFSSAFGGLGGGLLGGIGAIFGGFGGLPRTAVPAPKAAMPSARGAPAGTTVMNISIDARGADRAAVVRIEAGLNELSRTLPQRVGHIARDRQVRNLRY